VIAGEDRKSVATAAQGTDRHSRNVLLADVTTHGGPLYAAQAARPQWQVGPRCCPWGDVRRDVWKAAGAEVYPDTAKHARLLVAKAGECSPRSCRSRPSTGEPASLVRTAGDLQRRRHRTERRFAIKAVRDRSTARDVSTKGGRERLSTVSPSFVAKFTVIRRLRAMAIQ